VGYRPTPFYGLLGLESKWGILRSYVIIKKEYQGKRIAQNLFNERIKQSEILKPNIIMAVIKKANQRSINHCRARGYRYGGTRGKLSYFFLIMNYKGFIKYLLIRIFIPFLKITDTIRHIS